VRVCAFLVVAALWIPLEAQQSPSIEGADGQAVRMKCLGCHQGDLIAQQRMTRDGWDREIAKMERWGVTLSAAERAQMLTFLAGRFGRDVSSGAVPADGEVVYRAACRACHEDDLASQQRLSAVAWARTVDKMVSWGARVAPEQKPALVAYLASRWGTRR
jgi:cytochrome c2